MMRRQSGFTIIEVLLFLGISGVLLTAALIGVSANINNNRFNDAVRSTTSYLQERYSEVVAGRNDRPDSLGCNSPIDKVTSSNTKVPGMTNCVVLGRFIRIDGSKFSERYILGYSSSLLGASTAADDSAAILDMKPWVADEQTYAGSYDVPWAIVASKSQIITNAATSPPQTVDATSLGFAIIRSPLSGSVLYYTFPVTGDEPPLYLPGSTVIKSDYLNKGVNVCFKDAASRRTGYVRLSAGRGSEIIQTDLTPTGADCS